MTLLQSNKPSINAFDTETYQGDVKLICDAYGHWLEPKGNYEERFNQMIEFLLKYGKQVNFFYNLSFDFSSIVKPLAQLTGNTKAKKDALLRDTG